MMSQEIASHAWYKQVKSTAVTAGGVKGKLANDQQHFKDQRQSTTCIREA